MNKTKRIAFGIGVALAVLAVFTASATADNVVYFDPDPSCAAPGETIMVTMWLNNTDGVQTFSDDIYFDPTVVNITDGTAGDFPFGFNFVHHGNWVRVGGITADFHNKPPGRWVLVNFTVKGIGTGTSTLHHDHHSLSNEYGHILPSTWIDGTFNCPCPTPETFTKDLVEGWNLISLPLTADNMTVSSVFSSVAGKYDAIYSYDAETHSWVALDADDTLENGVGYFINMTENGTWTYTGMAYTAMNISLEPGLNLVGWVNCSENISDALSSIEGDYWYVARWNATAQKFEVYNPVAPPAFNDFTTMERGEGYFISMKSAGTLTASC